MYQIIQYGYRYEHPLGFTIDRPHGTADHLMVLFRTNVEISLSQGVVFTDRPCVILYDMHTPQLYSGQRVPMVADWFHFLSDDPAFLQKHDLSFNTVYYPTGVVELSGIIGVLQQNELYTGMNRQEISDHLVSCFLLMLAQDVHASPEFSVSASQRQRLLALREEIYQSPQKEWSVELLSREMYLSRSHFHQLYKKVFGTSPVDDIIQSRIRYAKYLLSTTPDITVEQTAQLCGYHSSVHLIRQFAQRTGKTPLQFKKEFNR